MGGVGAREQRLWEPGPESSRSEAPKKLRVFLCDDHPMVRNGLRAYLTLQDDIEICGEAGDGRTAVTAVAELRPDVVLMDLVMPGLDGVTAIAQIKAQEPASRVIALTSFADEDKVFPALKAGADGYLLKDVGPDELLVAIRAVSKGESVLATPASQLVLRKALGESPDAPLARLTPREREVLTLLARGHSNQAIAAQLFIGETTVKTHVSNILAKLEVADRTQAALIGQRAGLA